MARQCACNYYMVGGLLFICVLEHCRMTHHLLDLRRTSHFCFFGAENSRIISQELDNYQELRGYLIQTPTYCGNSFYNCVSKILKLQIIKGISFAWQPEMFIYMYTHILLRKLFRKQYLPLPIYTNQLNLILISSVVF